MGFFAELVSSVLLFSLVFGMSATVDVRQIWLQIHNWQALLIGVSLQFVILPFIGFLVVKALSLDTVVGITLLVITSSPGGSYSNWWCSMFNAELALSVTMTAISTLLSTVMLPFNLLLYTRFSYSADVVNSLDWTALFVSLVTVITGIACGMVASTLAHRRGHAQIFHKRANQLGNIAGLALITLSLLLSSLSSNHQDALWDQNAAFYIGVALPALIGLALALYLGTKAALPKPERVAVAIESTYQNTGIATSVALTMFKGDELAEAIGVPLYYGIVEAVMLGIFCVGAWKYGWTKAPKDERICVVLTNSYEVQEEERQEQELAVEVVLGSGDTNTAPNDLIFEQSDDGAYVVDGNSLEQVVRNNNMEDRLKKQSQNGDSVPGEEDSTEHGDGLSVADEGDHGSVASAAANTTGTRARLERTIASLRARAVGYRKTPLPVDGEHEHEHSVDEENTQEHRDERIPPSPLESADVEEPSSTYGSSFPSSSYQAVSVTSPESSRSAPSSVEAEASSATTPQPRSID